MRDEPGPLNDNSDWAFVINFFVKENKATLSIAIGIFSVWFLHKVMKLAAGTATRDQGGQLVAAMLGVIACYHLIGVAYDHLYVRKAVDEAEDLEQRNTSPVRMQQFFNSQQLRREKQSMGSSIATGCLFSSYFLLSDREVHTTILAGMVLLSFGAGYGLAKVYSWADNALLNHRYLARPGAHQD